jgi:Tfp pilus assembly PilM family ATPase
MAGKKVLSIEVGVQTTRLCEIEYLGKRKTVTNTCVFNTPEGTVEDGYIRNKDILAVSIKAAMKQMITTAKDVIFSISSSKIANREVNMPFLKEDKIQDFIHFSFCKSLLSVQDLSHLLFFLLQDQHCLRIFPYHLSDTFYYCHLLVL